MTFEQQDLQSVPEALEIPAPESDDLEGHETRRGSLVNLARGSRRYLFGLTFVAGLLLGWLIIGWWLWPVKWTNTDPWDLCRERQKTYIGLVAESFWWTKDIYRAREALAGWDGEAVAELLATMEREASSPEARQQLVALAEALEMPSHEESLWAVLGDKTIFLTAILSALPLMAAIFLAVFSLVQNRTRQAQYLLAEGEELEEALEEMPGQEELALEGEQDREQVEKEKEEEEYEEEEEEDDDDDDDDDEEEPWVQDLVSVLFDDDDDTELSDLEALCKKLPDIDVSELAEHSKKVANQLHRSNALHPG